jgi:hypothetical protein
MFVRVVKFIAIILIVILLYALLFGNLGVFLSLAFPKTVTQFEDFAECKDDFMVLCTFLRSYYSENGCSGRVVFRFSEDSVVFRLAGSTLSDYKVISVDFLTGQIPAAQNKRLVEGWIEENMIIFWENETKYYGLLYSERPILSLISIKSWHSGLESNKLDRNWYEIGVLTGR